MAIRVLGPVETDDTTLAPRERAVLAALVSRRGSIVTRDELAQAYWGEEPWPSTWWQQVKTAVTRLRRALGAGAIATEERGYRLTPDAGPDDATEFEQVVAAAREDRMRGLAERAANGYRRALSLWRGAPFPELDGWMPGRSEAARLLEIRSTVAEELVEVRLDLGEHRSVIADAEGLVRAEPLREVRWVVLARAQYLSGRQADALQTLRRARLRLVTDLGLDPGPELVELEAAMLRQDPALAIAIGDEADDTCPYRGLTAFGEQDARIFFGREAQIESLLSAIVGGRIVTILGASGNGKSSLVRAGIVPALRAAGRTVVFARPDAGLATELRDHGRRLPSDAVVVIDQFEDAIVLPEEVRDAACTEVGRLLKSGASVVTTLRSDHLDDAIRLPEIGDGIASGLVALAPLDVAGILEAITRPAAAAGLRLEGGLAELILRDAGDRQTVLPHLSHALVETWLRREGPLLTVEGYVASGGLVGAIAVTAETSFRSMSPSEQVACRATLTRLVERTSDGVFRHRIPISAFADDPLRVRVVERLIRARLVVIDDDELVVAHESLSTAWPRLSQWLDEDADSARVLRSLAEGSRVWDDGGRVDGDLMRGPRLAAGVAVREVGDAPLTPLEREFLEASARRDQLERDDLAARAAADRRQNRRLRTSLVAVAVLTVGALIAAGIAVVRSSDVEIAREDARIEALASTARELVSSDRDAAALLAAEIYRRYPDDVRSRSALLAVATDTDAVLDKLTYSTDERIFSAVAPSSTVMVIGRLKAAIGDSELLIDLHDFAGSTSTTTIATGIRIPTTRFEGLAAVSSDSRHALVAITNGEVNGYGEFAEAPDCCRSVVALVDLATGVLAYPPVSIDGWIDGSATFTADGTGAVFVVADAETGVASLVNLDVATGGVRPLPAVDLMVIRGLVPPVSLARDGRILVGAAHSIVVYDPAGRTVAPFTMLPGDFSSQALAALPDGGVLAAGTSGLARISAQGDIVWSSEVECFDLAVAGELFVCSDYSNLWIGELATGSATGHRIAPQSRWAQSLAVLGDGTLAVTTGANRASVQRFALDGSGPASRLIARGMMVISGFVDATTIPVTLRLPDPVNDPQEPKEMWNVATDAPLGIVGDDLTGMGDGNYVKWDEATFTLTLRNLDDPERMIPFRGEAFDRNDTSNIWPRPGLEGGRAFVIGDNWIVGIDPATGKQIGPALEFPGKDVQQQLSMIHEIPGTGLAVVTWGDIDESLYITAVFDLETGEEVARDLSGAIGSVGLPGGYVLTTTSSELRRSTWNLAPVDSLAKPVGGANTFELSGDQSTLLVQGPQQSAALYDVATGEKLVDDIATDSPFYESAHISPDAQTLVTNVRGGVLALSLRGDVLAASACRSAGRTFTETEWQAYFPGEPQVDTCALLEDSRR